VVEVTVRKFDAECVRAQLNAILEELVSLEDDAFECRLCGAVTPIKDEGEEDYHLISHEEDCPWALLLVQLGVSP
jgi:hypothetical protein